MFDGFNLVANAILPPAPAAPSRAPSIIAESIKRPSTAHQRAPSFRRSASRNSSASRPQSIASDRLSLPSQPVRSVSAMGQRKPSWATQRDSVIKSTLGRNSTILEEDIEQASVLQCREQVYRWDGIIGARNEWDCIRRVSFLAPAPSLPKAP